MNQTPNYALPSWEATDRILMEDFNDMTEKVDAALGTLGSIQMVDTMILSQAGNTFSFDVSNIDWRKCQMLLIAVDAPESSISHTLPWACNLNQNSASGHGTGSNRDFLRFGPNSFLIALLPFRQPQQNVFGIVIGAPSGVGFSSCTYLELTSLDFASSAPYPANTKATLWCVK